MKRQSSGGCPLCSHQPLYLFIFFHLKLLNNAVLRKAPCEHIESSHTEKLQKGTSLVYERGMPIDSCLRQVGRNLRDARANVKLRQTDIHEQAGLSYRHYQNIEAGRINVTVGTLLRLSKLFGKTLKDLVDGCE